MSESDAVKKAREIVEITRAKGNPIDIQTESFLVGFIATALQEKDEEINSLKETVEILSNGTGARALKAQVEQLTSELTACRDGGPAFPTPVDRPFGDGYMAVGGMTIRDYFAAKAMQGMISNHEVTTGIEALAKYAYVYADAMIAERSKT